MIEETKKDCIVLGPLLPDGTFLLLNSNLSSKAEVNAALALLHFICFCFSPIDSPRWIGTQGQYPRVAFVLPSGLM